MNIEFLKANYFLKDCHILNWEVRISFQGLEVEILE